MCEGLAPRLVYFSGTKRRPLKFFYCIFYCIFSLTDLPTCTLLFAFLQGTIVPARGKKHFGWDPIFQPEGFNQTYAELDPAVKNSISHRARALQALKEHLQPHEEGEWEKREGEHEEEEEEPKTKRPKTDH